MENPHNVFEVKAVGFEKLLEALRASSLRASDVYLLAPLTILNPYSELQFLLLTNTNLEFQTGYILIVLFDEKILDYFSCPDR